MYIVLKSEMFHRGEYLAEANWKFVLWKTPASRGAAFDTYAKGIHIRSPHGDETPTKGLVGES
jgi:hypothetical protein